ncbi:hypothetical protein DYH09_19855 [bacterium CPR1]|nr:hypothetical protein [bacterium CPR1]
MVHNVIATTFYKLERTCYLCSRPLECSVCDLLEENPWKLAPEELRRLRDELVCEQLTGLATGAAVCPNCELLVGCHHCRLEAPVDLEQVDERARRRRPGRTAA